MVGDRVVKTLGVARARDYHRILPRKNEETSSAIYIYIYIYIYILLSLYDNEPLITIMNMITAVDEGRTWSRRKQTPLSRGTNSNEDMFDGEQM